MASHSPQRARRPQAQQMNQGVMLNHPPRETSRSPSLRPRALKAQSMPMVPSLNAFSAQPTSQHHPQSNPTIPNTASTRRSPPPGQIQRQLPTPPQPNPPGFGDDRRPTPPPGPQQVASQPNIHSHYARPVPRAPIAAYPTTKFQDFEEQFKRTDKLMAEFDRAHQEGQAQNQSTQHNPYSSAPRGESPPLHKGPNVERVRVDRVSPTNPDPAQRMRREQQVTCESPRNRDHQSGSPSYPQQSHTPERGPSPNQQPPTIIPGEGHQASHLAQYNARESPTVVRRATINEGRLNPSMASQTPPSQAIPARNPDRSLPVQEEDEVSSKIGASPPSNWNDKPTEPPYRSPSPSPPSDLIPEGNNQRFENNLPPDNQPGLRDEEKASTHHDEPHSQYERDSTEDEGSHTPRSPTAGLPNDDHEIYYTGQNIPIRVPVPVSLRGKIRNGSTEHVMRGLESAFMETSAPTALPQRLQPSERPPQYAEQRQPPAQRDPHQFPDYPPSDDYAYSHDHQQHPDARFTGPRVYPDDFQSYGEESSAAYIHPYYQQSPRPDAPEPPTPHTQTAAPSPAPQLPGFNGVPKELPYRPIRAAGSPYPYPFNHMRRNRQMQTPGQRFYKNGIDQSGLHDQIARQWQVFAQNNQGNITDSTLSPSTTPFQPDIFDHWAYLHTNRMMRGGAMMDTASIHSSPSHQPIALPIAPNFSTKKKDRGLYMKRQSYNRKPPPRVESTQPRETSPELSSSGEETAGDERHHSAVEPPSGEPLVLPSPSTTDVAIEADDNGDWVDDDEDDDYEDLIDLEYHPAFVKNISKRRRKWEVGWENLIQAFQALDRQTDATMVLLASPSHTTKLHALRSRSIRRQSILANSVNMNQIRSGFAHMAAQRRATRPEKSSLVDRLMISSELSGGDGSDGSSGSVEENLRRALDAALGSLGAMGEVYEQREARVLEELQRSREDRERVELLLKQVLGDKNPLTVISPRIPAS